MHNSGWIKKASKILKTFEAGTNDSLPLLRRLLLGLSLLQLQLIGIHLLL